MAKVVIEHLPDVYKFVATMNGAQAVLQYKRLSNNTIDIYHTEVPEQFRGKGVAKQLCDNAFQYATKNNLKILPSCSYALKYASERSTTYKDVVIWPKTATSR